MTPDEQDRRDARVPGGNPAFTRPGGAPRLPRRRQPVERFGAGVCATGTCDEPCGEHGGCTR